MSSLYKVLFLFPCWLLLFYFKDSIAGWFVYNLLSFNSGEDISQTLAFFVTTFLKISLLLILIVFIMALVRTWLPVEKIRDRLRSMPLLPANILAGIFGVLTPFCSCSAIPLFIGFLETGIPLGITFSFLVASPLVNEVILIMIGGLFGFKISMIYLLAGLMIAVLSGVIMGQLQLEKYLPGWLLTFRNERQKQPLEIKMNDSIRKAFKTTREVISRIWIYVLAGIVFGAFIHGYIPDTWLKEVLSKNNWYSMPLVVLTGIPLYACSAAVAPVAFAMVDKGVPLGTALAFVMAVASVSLPEFIMLKKVLSTRILLALAGIVFTGILLVGYLFNWLL